MQSVLDKGCRALSGRGKSAKKTPPHHPDDGLQGPRWQGGGDSARVLGDLGCSQPALAQHKGTIGLINAWSAALIDFPRPNFGLQMHCAYDVSIKATLRVLGRGFAPLNCSTGVGQSYTVLTLDKIFWDRLTATSTTPVEGLRCLGV
jgi:hypothetical protein